MWLIVDRNLKTKIINRYIRKRIDQYRDLMSIFRENYQILATANRRKVDYTRFFKTEEDGEASGLKRFGTTKFAFDDELISRLPSQHMQLKELQVPKIFVLPTKSELKELLKAAISQK